MKRDHVTHCYVATRDGEPGAYAGCVDDPQFAKDTAKFVSDIIAEGGRVERVPISESGGLFKKWSEWNRDRKARQAALL